MINSRCNRLIVSSALLAFGTCAAAAEPLAVIEHCRAAASSEARIACLERALLQGDEFDMVAATPAPVLAEPSPEPDAQPPQRAATVAAAPAVASVAATPTTTAAESASAPVAQATPPTAAKPASADDLGVEQLDSQAGSDTTETQRFAIKVVAHDFVGRDKLRVRLENGQVWRQRDSDRPNLYPALRSVEEFEVELWRNSRGAYRMRVPAANRVIRVERIL